MKKLIIIIYTSVIVATGLCALFLYEQLNIIVDSLVPLGVFLFDFWIGYMLLSGQAYFWGGRIRISHMRRFVGGDFKYSKDKHGKGSFDPLNTDSESEARGSITNKIAGYLFMISAAVTIPFIFFFALYVKWWVSLAIFFVSFLSAIAVNAVVDILDWKNWRKTESEREKIWEKELEKQTEREEMGRWK